MASLFSVQNARSRDTTAARSMNTQSSAPGQCSLTTVSSAQWSWPKSGWLTAWLWLICATAALGAAPDDFMPLFNGRDLSGWINANCAPETWSVRDGVIHCTGKPTGALRTTRQYENFILEAEWRHLSSGGNSGIFIWGTPIAAPGVPFLRGI